MSLTMLANESAIDWNVRARLSSAVAVPLMMSRNNPPIAWLLDSAACSSLSIFSSAGLVSAKVPFRSKVCSLAPDPVPVKRL